MGKTRTFIVFSEGKEGRGEETAWHWLVGITSEAVACRGGGLWLSDTGPWGDLGQVLGLGESDKGGGLVGLHIKGEVQVYCLQEIACPGRGRLPLAS